MEAKQQQAVNEDGSNGKGGFLCRQSSTRWTPTTEQIKILKELYYNTGVRSPSADQIQRISARLRQYGKIEGKNVFYWFQNHKARERQKKRFTHSDPSLFPPKPAPSSPNSKPDLDSTKNPNHFSAAPSSVIGNYGYGSATVENCFRNCTISSGGSSSMIGSRTQNMGWIGVDPYSSSPYPNSTTTTFFEKRKSVDESMEDDHGSYEITPEIETLPLFPIHGDRNLNGFCNMKPEYSDGYYAAWYGHSDEGTAGSRTSLELSLNSYTTISPEDAI